MAGTVEMVEQLLSDLKANVGVEICAAVSRDGLLIRAIIQKELQADSLAAMSAAMLGTAEIATTQLEKGVPNRVIVETDHGTLIVMGAGPKALLILQAYPAAGLGIILLELDKAARKLREILK